MIHGYYSSLLPSPPYYNDWGTTIRNHTVLRGRRQPRHDKCNDKTYHRKHSGVDRDRAERCQIVVPVRPAIVAVIGPAFPRLSRNDKKGNAGQREDDAGDKKTQEEGVGTHD